MTRIEEYLKIFGAICIEGTKWCGKTWTSLTPASSVTLFNKKKLKKPRFMAIIVGSYGSVIKDEETGIYIFPITALKLLKKVLRIYVKNNEKYSRIYVKKYKKFHENM